jgi:hypothetical protein
MLGALVKRGVPQGEAEDIVIAILENPELRQVFTGELERR